MPRRPKEVVEAEVTCVRGTCEDVGEFYQSRPAE